jgi:putative heme-binding domain-containing protein
MRFDLVTAVCVFGALTLAVGSPADAQLSNLDKQLLAETPAALVAAAKSDGDAKRGAIVFYQPHMACLKCHSVSGKSPLGPNLSKLGKDVTDAHLVESVLQPSKSIRKGFDTVVVIDMKGKSTAGLLVEEKPSHVTIRDGRPGGKLITFQRKDIDEVTKNPTSIMPAGQMNQLASRQQFLDLIRYLIDIREGGTLRAKELEPAPALYAVKIPEYEKKIDHAGIIKSLDKAAFKRGEAIYNRLCINCHGDHQRPGSLPTSLRFASGKFRNGSDPYTMYQTLTRGFGMMVAQTWMVPQQKYDVIHYVREAYLKGHNESQLFDVSDDYVASLPKGDTRGPSPRNIEHWVNMNYGSSLINTYEVGKDAKNFAYKGIAMRLNGGPGGVSRGNAWMVFDHDTMRVAAAWTGEGFIDWNGIHFNGRHNIHPRVVGDIQFTNPTSPGWAKPGTKDEFEDPRFKGRDGRLYGPLPRKWAHYKGLYHYQDKSIIKYTVGDATVLEMPGMQEAGDVPVFTRTINVGPRSTDMTLLVATHNDVNAQLSVDASSNVAMLGTGSQSAQRPAVPTKLEFTGGTYAEAKADDLNMSSKDFTLTARIKTKRDGAIFANTRGSQWLADGQVLFIRGGRLCYDIGWVGAVTSNVRVNNGKWYDVAVVGDAKARTVELFVDGKSASKKTLSAKGPLKNSVARIGYCANNFPNTSAFNGNIQQVRFFQSKLSATDLTAVNSGKVSADVKKVQLASWALDGLNDKGQAADATGKHHAVLHKGDAPPVQSVVGTLVAGTFGADLAWSKKEGRLLVTIPAGNKPVSFRVWTARAESNAEAGKIAGDLDQESVDVDLAQYTKGGPPRWAQKVTSEVNVGDSNGAFAVDVLTRPATNPWLAQARMTGFDFFPDGDRIAISAWDGDVWMVSGLKGVVESPATQKKSGSKTAPKLTWQRIASGLFQPLGVKVVDGETIYVACRDQIVILRDLNGDGETDFYDSFNSDHQVTDHFHEFAMGLQRDAKGNFYYAKSARHALTALVPHHGTLLRVSKDGSKTDILATGFRAANGVCLNPDGSFIVTDQEGHWNPKNRINYVKEGGFYGNMFGYHDVTDSSNEAMEQPLCWITNSFDRSPAELLWCDSKKWGPLNGSLLNLSYGYGQVFVVPHEEVDGQVQGGMCSLPLPRFPTGLIRGRFNPADGQLYSCGMFAWAGSQHQPGGFYRIRYTGKPMNLPTKLSASKSGMKLTFTDQIDAKSGSDIKNYRVKVWSLKRTRNYGSKHYDEHEVKITEARVAADGRSVELLIPDISPTWCMEIRYSIKDAKGNQVDRVIHNTIHKLNP